MDDARLPPLNGDLRGRDDDELEAQFPADRNGSGFMHRQRAKAKFDPVAEEPPERANVLQTDADSKTPKRANSGSQLSIAAISEASTTTALPTHQLGQQANDISAKTTDLSPFADQLVAIAEQLRTGFFDADPSKDADQMVQAASPVPQELPTTPEVALGLQTQNTPPTSSDPVQKRRVFADMARTAYAKRRKRASIFGDPELFGEPGWDILLDLYIAQAEQKPVSVSSACIGSASPPTTGLRWLGVLADQGLVERKHDPEDQRRVLVRLTDKALEAMDTYFSSSANLQRDSRAAGS